FEATKRSQAQENREPWEPFVTRGEWELARWLVVHGLTKMGIDEFVRLGIVKNLTLSFTSYHTLFNKLKKLPSGPEWRKEEIVLLGNRYNRRGRQQKEKLQFWYRNPVEVVKEILLRPEFSDLLVYEPRETFVDESLQEHVCDEMWTGRWWKEIQKKLPFGAALIPLIWSTDKTLLTNHTGDREAYPIYLTIGNIPKATRRLVSARATVLVGYLPVSKFKCCTKGDARQQAEHWLFHTCMAKMMKSFGQAGSDRMEMECSDGWVRRCFPILGAYIADHPEQCLVACVKQNLCPGCRAPLKELGEHGDWDTRDPDEVSTEILAESLGINTVNFTEHGYKSVGRAPFWTNLPHSNIFESFTPDLLHQLRKGLFKDHLFTWCRFLAQNDELIDERFSVLPVHQSVLSFKSGVTGLSQTTGRQHKAMEKSLLPVLIGLVSREALQAIQAILNFINIASFTVHTDSTLLWLEETLEDIHRLKHVFVHPNNRLHFNFPKFHLLMHYAAAIRSRGTTDGYNSETTERLHIDYAKMGYRASNKKDYIKQMANRQHCLESISMLDAYILWVTDTPPSYTPANPTSINRLVFSSTAGTLFYFPKNPSFPQATRVLLQNRFAADGLFPALKDFLVQTYPDLSRRFTENERLNIYIKANLSIDPAADPYAFDLDDCIHASPADPNNSDDHEGHFDTVIIRKHPKSQLEFGMSNHLIARLRVLFRLEESFGIDEPLAYVEWFNAPADRPVKDTGLYRVRRKLENGIQASSVIPISYIRRSCRLIPDF
ncbi:hypothetical protein BDV93DRAFT_420039, partial [Ceratobasidium sp. AG-I]